MRQKKLASSKSKSQWDGTHERDECRACGHIRGMHLRRNYLFPCKSFACGCWDFNEPIVAAPSVPQEPLSEPEPCLAPSEPADVVITQDSASHCWCIMCGHVKSVIVTENGGHFNQRVDPVMVAKYLASKAAGPINVIWW